MGLFEQLWTKKLSYALVDSYAIYSDFLFRQTCLHDQNLGDLFAHQTLTKSSFHRWELETVLGKVENLEWRF